MAITAPHAGSWGGLPDFGITEKIGDFLGGGRTAQGGSSLGVSGAPTSVSPYQQSTFANPVPSYTPQPHPSVLGTSTSIPTPTAPTTGGGQVPSTPAQQGPNPQDQLAADLNSIFDPIFSGLNQQEQTLNQNYAPVEGQIQAQGDLSKQTLADQQAAGMRDLSAQETAAGTRQQDALSSATRLYDELQRGGRQRFGGASSAGEAYQTLTATEQQRRQGDISKSYEQAIQQVNSYKANLQDKYQTAVKEVTLQTQQAIADAQAQFRDALQSLNSARNQAQSDKATASFNALQDLRNKVYSINQQSMQFAQQLALNHEASLKYVDQFTQQALQSVGGATNAVNQSQNQPLATSYGIVPGQQTANTSLQTGRATPSKPYDPNDPSTW